MVAVPLGINIAKGGGGGIKDLASRVASGARPARAPLNMVKRGMIQPKATQAGAIHAAHHAIGKKAHFASKVLNSLPQRKLLKSALNYGRAASMKTRK